MDTLTIIAVAAGAIWFFCLVVAIFSRRSILRSSLKTAEEFIEADMVYYLPRAAVQLNATAKITVIKELSAATVSPVKVTGELAELSVAPEVTFLPDTSFLFALNHIGNWFMNDEYKMTAGTTGLLDTITA